jgi:hypothetical protein
MRPVSEHIKLLLFEHECVIVPGLGGFIKNRPASSYNRDTHEFRPLTQLPFFNRQLRNNDGLLASSLAEKEHLSYSQALKEIESFVNFVTSELKSHRVMQLKGLGRLSMNENDQLAFLPDDLANLCVDSFGLPVIQPQPVRKVHAGTEMRKSIRPERKKGRKFVPALVCLLIAVAGCWTFFYNDNELPKQLGILNPFGIDSSGDESAEEKREGKEEKPEIAPVVQENTKQEPIESEVAVVEEPEEILRPEATYGQEKEQASDSVFYIVLGVFSKEKNAVSFEYRLKEKGFSALSYKSEESPLIRVCAEQHSKRFEAEERLAYLYKKESPGAWILAVKKP